MDLIRLVVRASTSGGCTKETCPASDSICTALSTHIRIRWNDYTDPNRADGYAPNLYINVAFTALFTISSLVFSHQAVLWKNWRNFSIVLCVGCQMEVGGEFLAQLSPEMAGQGQTDTHLQATSAAFFCTTTRSRTWASN